MYRIESLLSGRLFMAPQLVNNRLYFISNLSGRLSLYAMDHGGSVPEPLLPPDIALQNPHLTGGAAFAVFPQLDQIMVMMDKDGNEIYQPMMLPITGGYPEPLLPEIFDGHRVFVGNVDPDDNLMYAVAASLSAPNNLTYQVDVANKTAQLIGESLYGLYPDADNSTHKKIVLNEGYTVGDNVLYLYDKNSGEKGLIFGKPLDQRAEGEQVPLASIGNSHFIRNDKGLLVYTALFEDTGGLAYLDLAKPGEVTPVEIQGVQHTGMGELGGTTHLKDNRYMVTYNIDGADWAYEGTLDEENLVMRLERVLLGKGELHDGVAEHIHYEKRSNNFAVSFSTAISPTEIYTLEGPARTAVKHTRERILGLPDGLLSEGEDASFTSFDGLRVSARLYLPAAELGYESPRPLVYYIHGGPQGQERPDFAWFSMPLIQFLTLNGFAVFVPNVRGSTGYGLSYTKKVDRDWGGDDRLDHVHAMTKVLPNDPRIDVKRAAVVGRSYGGYMTLTLAGRHPELWSAACDMFGPYDLFSFLDRIPETWKPYFVIALGHPEKDKDLLTERSPRTHIDNMTCPMLVIQGRNDPRVVAAESADLVEHLRSIGKDVEFLVFENEGHDVLKYENRVTCYNTITDFFSKHLRP